MNTETKKDIKAWFTVAYWIITWALRLASMGMVFLGVIILIAEGEVFGALAALALAVALWFMPLIVPGLAHLHAAAKQKSP